MPHKRAKRSIREHLRSQTGTDLPPPKSAIVKKGGKGDIANEAIPKSLARVLNAAKVREGYREKKRKNDEDDGQEGGGKRRKVEVDGKEGKTKEGVSGILAGESLQHYNKRVEASMRPLVRSAVQTSLAVSRSADRKQREEIQDKKRQRKEKEAQQKQDNKNDKKTGKGSNSVSDDDGDDDSDDNDEIPQNSRSKSKPRATEFEAYSASAPRRLNDIAQAPPQLKSLKARGAAIGHDGLPTSSGMGKKHDGVVSMAQKHMMEMEREKAVKRYRELKAQRERDKEVKLEGRGSK